MKQSVLWPCDPVRSAAKKGKAPVRSAAKKGKAPRASRDFVARLRGWADEANAEGKRKGGDEAAALEDVAEELRALALMVEAARGGRLPDGVLRVAGEQRRAAAARRKNGGKA